MSYKLIPKRNEVAMANDLLAATICMNVARDFFKRVPVFKLPQWNTRVKNNITWIKRDFCYIADEVGSTEETEDITNTALDRMEHLVSSVCHMNPKHVEEAIELIDNMKLKYTEYNG